MGGEKIPEKQVEEFYVKEFKKDYRRGDYLYEIEKLVVEAKYGAETRMPLPPQISWKGLFRENKCPACGGVIALKDEAYECGSCTLKIPAEKFGEASKHYEDKITESKNQKEFGEKALKSGYTQEELQKIIGKASEKAFEKHGKKEE